MSVVQKGPGPLAPRTEMDINSFRIDKAIIHEITDRVLAPPAPPELVLSNASSPLDDDLKIYFQSRIAESLRLAAFPVIANPDRTSPTPALVHELFARQGSTFVDVSKAIATHLFEAQAKVRSSPGLLVSAMGDVDDGPSLAILKLQKQEGVNVERSGKEGEETYNVEHLRRLMLTNDTRVFKVAMFGSDGVTDPEAVYALVSDKQRYSSPDKRMANFFLQEFLGCRLRDDPAQTTSACFLRGEQYFNDRVADPEKRARYHRAWVTEFTSQADQLAPKRFAENQLDETDRPGFLDFLKSGNASTTQFPKELDLIESRLREEEYVLESGIRVRGTRVALDTHAEIARKDDDVLEMLITDRLKSVKGTNGRHQSRSKTTSSTSDG